jgi:late competence protein required for DNA uptake (superfamily II DNA/RNA helicase)
MRDFIEEIAIPVIVRTGRRDDVPRDARGIFGVGVRRMTAIPTRTQCQRCKRLFSYLRARRPRLYCAPCVELERIDANKFFNAWTKQKRQQKAIAA